MDEEKLEKELEETELINELHRIRDIYNKLEEDQKRFCDFFCIHCKKGCGSCCEHFVPDITNLEAEYLAYGLISEDKDEEVLKMFEGWDNDRENCPLYNYDDPSKHCTVYKWRPMICRLFGASASKDKNSKPVFRECKWNDHVKEHTTIEFESNKEYLVLMSDYGELLEDVIAGDNKTEMLPIALTRAINKIRYIMELEEQSKIDIK